METRLEEVFEFDQKELREANDASVVIRERANAWIEKLQETWMLHDSWFLETINQSETDLERNIIRVRVSVLAEPALSVLLHRALDEKRIRHDHAYPMEIGPHHCAGCDLENDIRSALGMEEKPDGGRGTPEG